MLLMKPVKVVNRRRDFGPFFTVSPLYEPSVLRGMAQVRLLYLRCWTFTWWTIYTSICTYAYMYIIIRTYMYINVNIDTNSAIRSTWGMYFYTVWFCPTLTRDHLILFYARKNHGSNVSKPPLIWCACPWLKPSCRLSLKHYLLTVTPFDKVAILLSFKALLERGGGLQGGRKEGFSTSWEGEEGWCVGYKKMVWDWFVTQCDGWIES